jgi:predicted nucleic acid-binding protein
MTLPTTSNPARAVGIDASVTVAIAAKETDKEPQASTEIVRYSGLGYDFFAPGAVVTETLYVLCKKLESGALSAPDHAQAIQDFHAFMSKVFPPPNGDGALILRTEAIRGTYTCRGSADGVNIALAEELTTVRPTVLLTFDEDMVKQANNNAPTVNVQLLTI